MLLYAKDRLYPHNDLQTYRTTDDGKFLYVYLTDLTGISETILRGCKTENKI